MTNDNINFPNSEIEDIDAAIRILSEKNKRNESQQTTDTPTHTGNIEGITDGPNIVYNAQEEERVNKILKDYADFKEASKKQHRQKQEERRKKKSFETNIKRLIAGVVATFAIVGTVRLINAKKDAVGQITAKDLIPDFGITYVTSTGTSNYYYYENYKLAEFILDKCQNPENNIHLYLYSAYLNYDWNIMQQMDALMNNMRIIIENHPEREYPQEVIEVCSRPSFDSYLKVQNFESREDYENKMTELLYSFSEFVENENKYNSALENLGMDYDDEAPGFGGR